MRRVRRCRKDFDTSVQSQEAKEFRHWLRDQSGLGDALRWLMDLPFEHKVVVGGNHDYILEQLGDNAHWLCQHFGLHYLDTKDEPCGLQFEHGSVNVWGSPASAVAGLDKTRAVASGNNSFQIDVNDGQALLDDAGHLREGAVDVMVTHTPPEGMLMGKKGKTLSSVNDLIDRVKPQLYVCGHAHNGDDLLADRWAPIANGIGVNAACLSNWNYLHGAPVVADIRLRAGRSGPPNGNGRRHTGLGPPTPERTPMAKTDHSRGAGGSPPATPNRRAPSPKPGTGGRRASSNPPCRLRQLPSGWS